MIDKALATPSLDETSVTYRSDGARSRALFDRALMVMPGGNTRHSVALNPYPVYIANGRGCRVKDVEGQERIDFLNNFTSLILGHADPEVTAAARDRIEQGTAFAGPTEADVELAELLVERVPAIDHVRFCNSGSEAVMLAVKAARAFTGRPKLAKIEGAYHGIYDYAQMSEVSAPLNWGSADRPASVPDAGTAPQAGADVVVLPWNDPEVCERLIDEHGGQLAAVILDSLPLGLSMIPPLPGFLERVVAAARRHSVLVIADEILNFRLGYHGAFASAGIQSDIVCLAKIIGGGFPVGAVGGRADIMDVFDHRRPDSVHHGGTYNGNPVSMVAGLVTMRRMTPEAYLRLNRLGDSLRDQIGGMLRSRGIAAQVFGRGSLFSVRLTAVPLRNWRDLSNHTRNEPIYGKICHGMLGRGIMMSQRGIMGSLSTPMGPSEIGAFVEALDSTLASLGRTA
jgi:glutamate-1-semialdehyde 2,1-aminomutase